MKEQVRVIDYDDHDDDWVRFTIFRSGTNGQTYSARYNWAKESWSIRNLHSGHRIRPGGRIGTRLVNAAAGFQVEAEE